jgi:hypothetical protein
LFNLKSVTPSIIYCLATAGAVLAKLFANSAGLLVALSKPPLFEVEIPLKCSCENKKVEENNSVIKVIKWLFTTVIAILIPVATLVIQEIFFKK